MQWGNKDKPTFMRQHIWEQIKWRIEVMDRECYNDGACKICGCSTTALQMCDKACDKPCYPSMMDEYRWKKFNKEGHSIMSEGYWWSIHNSGKLMKGNVTI